MKKGRINLLIKSFSLTSILQALNLYKRNLARINQMRVGHYYNDGGLSTMLVYSEYPDVQVALHRLDGHKAEHVAQVSYQSTKEKGISVYVLPTTQVKTLHGIGFAREIPHEESMSTTEREALFREFSINVYQHGDAPSFILNDIARDVHTYVSIVKKVTPKTIQEPGVWNVEEFPSWE